ncbi:MAG: class IV adenylate cyclase [Terriglobia bacterium]
MKHRPETEIKLEVKDAREIRRRFAELGFRLVRARHFESNYLFDFPDQRLRKSRRLVRLRFTRDQWLLTYKGTPKRSRDYKIRPEIETHVEDGDRLREFLLQLGLGEVFRYDKFRTVYAPPGKSAGAGAPNVVLDETPIGDYLELEGPQRWIDVVARQLEYSRRQYITDSYAALYRKHCQTEHQPVGNMIFPSRES